MNEFYTLKMENPTQVDLYYNLTLTSNLDTGDNTPTKSKATIKRAVVSSFKSKYRYFVPADGVYEREDQIVLVDWRDLKNYNKDKEDYFVISGKKYRIVTHEYIVKEGHVFVVRNVQNERPNQEVTLNFRHMLPIHQTSEIEP